MEKHEVIIVTLDDDETITKKREATKQKSFTSKTSAPSIQPISKRKRGWDGLDIIATIEGHGVGKKLELFIFLGLMLIVFFMPVDPQAKSLVFNNESANLALKIVSSLIMLATAYWIFFAKRRVVITKPGFYWRVLWRKFFFSWDECSEFTVIDNGLAKNNLFKNKTDKLVTFNHPEKPVLLGLSLPNVSVEHLCKRMDEYRDQFNKP